MEIRIESVNEDNSHSWVRISDGLNKWVTDLIDKEYDDDEQETSTTKTEVFAFASRSKAKAKPRRPSTACSSPRTIPILERTWIDIEPGAQYSQYWSGETWKSKTQGGGNNKRLQHRTDPSRQEILYFRALQRHSGRNPTDPSLQGNVSIPNNFFEYIYHVGCAVNLHSITKSGLIAGGQNSRRDRQYSLLP